MRPGEWKVVVAIDATLHGSLLPAVTRMEGSARLTLYRTGVLKAITRGADGWYKDHELYTLAESSKRQGSSRAVAPAIGAESPLAIADHLAGPSTRYQCFVLDNHHPVSSPEGVSDHAVLSLVNVRDRKHVAWIYGPVRPWWVGSYSADFYRRTPDLTAFLALARDVVIDIGGYCEVF